MSRVLLPIVTLGLLLMPVAVPAIPICPAGSMADYTGFGATGCQFNSLTFSNFSYSNPGGVVSLGAVVAGIPPIGRLFPPPSGISVKPRSDPPTLGSGGAALQFKPFPLFPDLFWIDAVFIDFTVAGPGIVRNDLAGDLQPLIILHPSSAHLGESVVPGGSLELLSGTIICDFDPMPSPTCASGPRSLSISPTQSQTVSIFGDKVYEIDAGFATPEPATLLLVGTGAAGLGVARWIRRRRSSKLEDE
jgi:hypothetical protein